MPTHYLSRSVLVITTLLCLSGCNLNTLLLKANDTQDSSTENTATTEQSVIAEKPDTAPIPDPAIPDRIIPEPKQPQDIDLWQRVRNGFKLQVPENKLVTRHVNWFKKHNSYINRLQERATPYLHFITQEAEKRGLPAELVLLPAVESAYQPFAYSHGRAAGLWQFVPSTGKHFKLKQNWWYDGRRDVVASTKAAFDYLESLARRFDGDWELALAAYNSGAGTVSSAIRKNRRKGLPTDFWSLKLPRETCDYVPRLLALSKVINEPAEYGISLKPMQDKPYFASVDIGSQLDLALAADMADVTTNELYMLNPGYNRWATAPGGPHRLILPVAKVEKFTQKLAKLDPAKRIRWKRYKVRSGDSMSTIAQKHGTTSALIRQANKLSNNNIRAGKYLVIPMSTKALDHYALSADKRKQKIQNRNRKGNKVIHVVTAGDNFWDLSRHYRVSHRKLAKWNGMAPKDTLKLGQKLVVWLDDKTAKTHQTTKLPTIMDVRPPNTRNSLHYRVRNGDSLSTIAQRFKVKVADLKKWNTLEGKYLKPGQNLKLYVDVTAQTL
jgi:peptidoglycan lytic transglycosylase D